MGGGGGGGGGGDEQWRWVCWGGINGNRDDGEVITIHSVSVAGAGASSFDL